MPSKRESSGEAKDTEFNVALCAGFNRRDEKSAF